MRVGGPEFFDVLGDAAASIGTADFHRSLLRLIGGLVKSDTRLVMRYSRFTAPDYVIYEGLPQYVIDLYQSGYYRFDPFYRFWRQKGRCGVVSLRDVISPRLARSDYFTVFVPKAHISDDLGLFLPAPGGIAIALFVERRSGRFSVRDAERLRLVYPTILGLHKAHLSRLFMTLASNLGAASSPETPRAVLLLDRDRRRVFVSKAWREAEAADPGLGRTMETLVSEDRRRAELDDGTVVSAERLDPDFPLAPRGRMYVLETGRQSASTLDYEQAVARFLPEELTPRECEIVRLILAGHSSEAIAKALAIGRGTVKNHRRRLYYKLDITSERELFSLFLDSLAEAGKGSATRLDAER